MLRNNLRLPGSSVQSGARSTSTTISNLVGATLLAGLILFGGGAKAQNPNVLVNPSGEGTSSSSNIVGGSLANWNISLTGYSAAVSTNSVIPNTTQPLLPFIYSGITNAWSIQIFDTTSDSSYIWQDIAADPGSVWSASCYTICYASNYFQSGAAFVMQVSFYDISNNCLGGAPGAFNPATNTYGSVFLDPSGPPFPGANWVTNPPEAVDATGWMFLPATNVYDTDPASEGNFDESLATSNLTAPAGTVKVRYELLFTNSASSGGDVYVNDCILNETVGTDPDIASFTTVPNVSGNPLGVRIIAGLPATMTVVGVKVQKAEILKYQWQKNGTNLPALGGVDEINGPTTNSILSITNAQADADGLYSVVVTDVNNSNVTNSISSVPVPLIVLFESPLQKVNVLGPNSGFENNPAFQPWHVFNGCYFATTNNFYGVSSNAVNVFDGNSVCLVGANGDRDNGFDNAFPAAPGTVWKAGGWAYISSSNDFTAGNTCRLQIWFKDPLNLFTVSNTPTYESFKIYGTAYTNSDETYTNLDTSSPNFGQITNHVQLPRDQWVFLQATNNVNNSGVDLENDLPTNTLPSGDFVVPLGSGPTNVGTINFQVYEYGPEGTDNVLNNVGVAGEAAVSSAADSVYWDDMELIQVLGPTNLSATVSGHNINLSFAGQAGLDFAVLYKTNLTQATWSVLTNNVIAPLSWQTNANYQAGPSNNVGTYYYPITVTDTVTATKRFYMVQAQ
jgi:hypothetical protein